MLLLTMQITAVSNPKFEPKMIAGESAEQLNAYDCGICAIYNAVELLHERVPSTSVNGDGLGLQYLKLLLSHPDAPRKQ